MAYRILHISDQHFTHTPFWSASRQELESPLSAPKAEEIARNHFTDLLSALPSYGQKHPFDAILLGGDFTHHHRPHGFKIASAWVRLLIEAKFAESPDRILMVPGNHDVNLGKTYPVPRGAGNGAGLLAIPRIEAEREYRAFLEDPALQFPEPNPHLSSVLRVFRSGEGHGLIVVALNSSRIERHGAKGWGYVGADQLDAVFRDLLAQGLPQAGDSMIVFTHHNPLPIWDVALPETNKPLGERKFSFLMDAPTVLEALTSAGFIAFLHGHSHLSKLAAVEGYDFRRESFREKLVISAQGSFCADLTDSEKHDFAVINVERDAMTVSSFSAQKTKGTRRWVAAEGLYQPNYRRNSSSRSLSVVQTHLKTKALAAASQWQAMESWAPLYVYESAGPESPEWQRALEKLTADVSDLEGRPFTVAEIRRLSEAILTQTDDPDKLKPGDISGTYLPQFLLWRLKTDGLSET